MWRGPPLTSCSGRGSKNTSHQRHEVFRTPFAWEDGAHELGATRNKWGASLGLCLEGGEPAVFAHELAVGSDVVEVVAPNVVLVAHWKRLRDGELYAVTPRIPWALWMRRMFDVGVLPWAAGHHAETGRVRA